MAKMLKSDMQLLNEESYGRHNIDRRIEEEILANPEMVNRISQGVELLTQWIAGSYYESKSNRITQLKVLDLKELVTKLFVGVSYCQTPELFTSVTSLLASRLKFSDKREGIQTIGEVLAVLCETDAFDIVKESKYASLVVVSNIPLSSELLKFIGQSNYLPPMVCQPQELKKNYQSGYLTFNDSLILGKKNHHTCDICLDVLNSKNSVPLKLNTEFLSTVEETSHKELDTIEKQRNWAKMKLDSFAFYKLIVGQGNEFYLTHKVDKRGRNYAQGYHITTQGSPFKKAMIELAEEEVVQGVPTITDKD